MDEQPPEPFSAVDNAPDFAALPYSDAAAFVMDELLPLAAYYFVEAPSQVAAVEIASFAAA